MTEKSHFQDNQGAIKVFVRLGSPKRKCQYTGICEIEVEDTSSAYFSRLSGTWLEGRISRLGKQLAGLRFRREHIAPQMRERHFRAAGFEVKDAYWLPEGLNAALGMEPGSRIAPGIYTIESPAGHLSIAFPLKGRQKQNAGRTP